jgi:hypothetical protein
MLNTELVGYSIGRLLQSVYGLFLKHPRKHHLSYYEHFMKAMRMSYYMGYGATCLGIHAVFPFLLEKSGSDVIMRLYLEWKLDEILEEEMDAHKRV